MRVLVLGVGAPHIVKILRDHGDEAVCHTGPLQEDLFAALDVDFAVSYRYRFLIRPGILARARDRIINLHISLLPWNRGADPNLWSFLEDTPRGVTIHYVDEGLDTGDIIAQKEVFFDLERDTLATTYEKLNVELVRLFEESWPLLLQGNAPRKRQPSGGTFHRQRDKQRFLHLLEREGWNTPVRELLGKAKVGPDE